MHLEIHILEFYKQLCERIFFVLPGLTDSKIGELVGVKRQTIQGWRKGKSLPTLAQLLIISELSEISWQWLMTGRASDPRSIVNAFYPYYYDNSCIKDVHTYSLARNFSRLLLLDHGCRKYLPLLSIIDQIAFVSGRDSIYYHQISKTNSILELLSEFHGFSEVTVDARTATRFSEMSQAYIRPTFNSTFLISDILHTNNQKEVNAYSNPELLLMPRVLDYNTAKLQTGNMLVRVRGDNMSPIIADNQRIIIDEPLDIAYLSTEKPALVVIRLDSGALLYSGKQLLQEGLVCCYALKQAENTLLSGFEKDQMLGMISNNYIKAIYPVGAVLYN